MKITCPACAAEYKVDPSRIPATGLNMRCPKCAKSFSVSAEGVTTPDDKVGGSTVLDGGGHAIQSERLYVKRATGKIFGPFDHNAIKMMLQSNKIGTDSEVSADKQDWQRLVDIPAFSQFVQDKPLPDLSGEDPRATHIGWQVGDMPNARGADLPAPKADLPAPKFDLPAPKSDADLPAAKGSRPPGLPIPKRSGPPELPALKAGKSSIGLPVPKGSDLPQPKGSDLPQPKGSELPQPRGSDLPTPRGAELPGAGGLPVPRASELPAPKSDLPTPRAADLPVSARESQALPVPKPDLGDDLFGGGDDDLFGEPAGREDDLFGDPLGGDDDLFGSAASEGDDLFGSPASEASENLFGSPDDDLFGAPSEGQAEESDLFGSPASEGEDDLFASPAATSKDDFLGGDAGFSFLDDAPKANDDWGDDLFSDESSVAHEERSAPAASNTAADAWGDDLLDLDPAPPKKPASAVALDDDDPFRPASRGLREPDAAVAEETPRRESADVGSRRGSTAIIGGVVLLVALVGIGYVVVSNFMTDEIVSQPADKKEGPTGVDEQIANVDTYAAYAPLADEKRDVAADDEGKELFLQSLMLARYPDEKVAASAKKLAEKLDGSRDGWKALGRGAYEAQAGNADAARAYVEPLAGGDLAYYAHLVMGIGDTRAVEAERAKFDSKRAPRRVTPPPAPAEPAGTNNSPDEEDASETKGATAEDATPGGTNDGTNQAAEAAQPAPVVAKGDTPDYGGLVERGHRALDAAIKANGEAVTPHYWKGRLARLANQPDLAKQHLTKATELGPKHPASHVELGVLHYELGNLNDAIDLLEKVSGELSKTASNGENARALHYGGLVHVARRQSDLAIESFTKALTIDPSRSDTLRALAEEYERAQKYKEALNFFTTNKNLGKKDPEVLLGIVRSHIGLEQWPQAVATLEEGQRLFPEDPQFPYYLGQLHMKRYAYADARKPLERAVEIDPTLLSAQATLALLAWAEDKDIPAAERHIQVIVSYPDLIDAAVAGQVAEYYKESGNRTLAEQWYREGLQRDPNHWPTRLALSRLLLEEGKEDQARDLLERARKEGVQDVRLSAYLADAYRQANDFDRAIDEINKVIEAFPKNKEYVFIRGRIHFDRGNLDTAQNDFQRAYDLDPRYHDAYFYVGRTAFERKDYETALKIFRHVLDYKPDRGDYRFMMARTLESLRRETQALDEYRKATAVDPAYGIENPMVYVHRGRLLSKLGYSKEGKEDIARALELAPDNPDALLAMGESDFRDKAYESAIVNYRKALEQSPEVAEAQYRLGMALLYTDRRQEAAQRLQLAVKYGYDDPEVYKRLGYIYRDMGQRSDARAAFTKFLELAQAKGNVPTATKREVLDQIDRL